MSDNTFERTAPGYWNIGYRVVPIEPGTKIPAKDQKGWPGLAAAVPNAAKQTEWLRNYRNFGIGVLLGIEGAAGNVVVAVDVDDDQLIRLARALLPGSDVGKRGKKGVTLFGQIPVVQKPKSMTLKGAEGVGNVCPSSDNLRLFSFLRNGGSGSSGFEVMRPAADAASVCAGLSGA